MEIDQTIENYLKNAKYPMRIGHICIDLDLTKGKVNPALRRLRDAERVFAIGVIGIRVYYAHIENAHMTLKNAIDWPEIVLSAEIKKDWPRWSPEWLARRPWTEQGLADDRQH